MYLYYEIVEMVMNLICFPLNTKPISTEIKFYFMLRIGVLL